MVRCLGEGGDLATAVSLLDRLHCVVERVSVTQTFLSLPADCNVGSGAGHAEQARAGRHRLPLTLSLYRRLQLAIFGFE